MTVLKLRKRMISVRLSDDEYSALKALCVIRGNRSVSDLTRDAVRGLLSGKEREDVFTERLEEFRLQIKVLDRRIAQLQSRIEPSRIDFNGQETAS